MLPPSVRVKFVFRPTKARNTLPSFGEKLKLEREKRKISLEQISSSTKIGTRMLQALEEDKFNQLPGGVFNKGFVRAYARVVGLDEDQAVADYLEASGEMPRPAPVPRDAPAHDSSVKSSPEDTAARNAREIVSRHEENRIRMLEAKADESRPTLPWGLFAAILLLIALALSLWSHRRREQERLATHPPAKTTVEQNSTPPQSAPPSASVPSTENPTPPPASGNQGNATSPASGASTGAPATMPSAKPTTSPQTSPAQTTALQPALGEFMVLLHAREQSWISVSVDGKAVGSEVIDAGTDRSFRAHDRVFVKAGNAGALDFQLDGKKLEVGGDFGEVKSVTIGRAGVITTTSQPPANP